MSTSNAAAIRRRTNLPQTVDAKLQQQFQTQNQQSSPSGNVNAAGLTLPQVIAVVDKRLLTLETFMKDTKETLKNPPQPTQPSDPQPIQIQEEQQFETIPKEVFNAVVQEFNNRFEILAFEINSMKDTILKLQTYTMDVNKMLLEERTSIQDIGSANLTITDVNNDLENTITEIDQTQDVSV
jgi:hypothetical protein